MMRYTDAQNNNLQILALNHLHLQRNMPSKKNMKIGSNFEIQNSSYILLQTLLFLW